MNNKGYMLVEIIMAFAITFALIYFLMDMVIGLKNKNNDIVVETVVKTDQAIITNKLMNYVIDEEKNFNCQLLKDGITEKSIKYGEEVINVVDDKVIIDKNSVECNSNDLGRVSIKIPMKVKQMSNKNFDVVIDYKYIITDMIPPSCSLSVDSVGVITASFEDIGSGASYYGWNSSYEGFNSNTKTISSTGDYIFYVKDYADNVTTCKLNVSKTTKYCDGHHVGNRCYYIINGKNKEVDFSYKCPSGYTKINYQFCYKIG